MGFHQSRRRLYHRRAIQRCAEFQQRTRPRFLSRPLGLREQDWHGGLVGPLIPTSPKQDAVIRYFWAIFSFRRPATRAYTGPFPARDTPFGWQDFCTEP